jgi:hypothetical protein
MQVVHEVDLKLLRRAAGIDVTLILIHHVLHRLLKQVVHVVQVADRERRRHEFPECLVPTPYASAQSIHPKSNLTNLHWWPHFSKKSRTLLLSTDLRIHDYLWEINLLDDLLERIFVGNPDLTWTKSNDTAVFLVSTLNHPPYCAPGKADLEMEVGVRSVPRAWEF